MQVLLRIFLLNIFTVNFGFLIFKVSSTSVPTKSLYTSRGKDNNKSCLLLILVYMALIVLFK